MKNKNPFNKGTLAHLFYSIDNTINTPKIKASKRMGLNIVKILKIVVLPFQIIFIIAKLLIEILWAITIGLIISSIAS